MRVNGYPMDFDELKLSVIAIQTFTIYMYTETGLLRRRLYHN